MTLARCRVAVLVPTFGVMLLAGCGSTPRDQGFSDVSNQVRERSGVDVQWQTGSSEDAAVAQRIDELLAAPLTPESAVQIALLNNPRLHATYQELGVSQADLVQAGMLRNPTLNGSVKFFDTGPLIEISLVENLLGIFTIPARKRLAETQLAGAKARVAGSIIDLIGDVRRAIYRCNEAELRLALLRESFAAGEAAGDLAKRIHDAGNSTDLQFDQEQAVLEQARIDVAKDENMVADAREDLAVLLGLWGHRATAWSTTQVLPELPEVDGTGDGTGIETEAIRASLDLAAQRESIRGLGEHFGIARLDAWFGDVELGLVAERENDGTWGVGPAAGIALPLFDQGQGRRAEATARLEMAARTYLATAVEIRSQARRARFQVRSSFSQARYQAQVLVPLRTRTVKETLLHYNGMLVGPFQLITAKRDELAARSGLIAATARYWIARTILDQVRSGRMAPLMTDQAPTMDTSVEKAHD